jgi:hypothetical protein
MRLLKLAVLFVILLSSAAFGQNNGDKLNLNGVGPRLLNSAGLKTLKFSTLEFTNPAITTLDKLTQWTSGGIQAWAPYKAGSGPGNAPMFNSLTGNWEIEAYPNQSMIEDLGITGLYSIDADGALVIQPRLLKPAEQTAINQTIANLDAGNVGSAPALRNIRWLSGWVDTMPAAIKPPFVIGARIQLPFPCKQGYWPAVWLLDANAHWPPETDILENVCRNDLGFQLTANMHSSDSATGNQPSVTVPGTFSVPWNANGPGYHDYWAVVYNDRTHIFYDGVKVGGFITPPDWKDQPAYLIINYALAGQNNGWPGPLDPSITSVPPMKILDVYAAQMPATYGVGTATTYAPPSGASLITVGATAPPPVPTQAIALTTTIPATVSGTITLSGTGAGNLNIAAFTSDWVKKIGAADVKPTATGAWTVSIDTTKLPVGATTAMVAGFSTASGVAGGTSVTTAPFTLNVVTPPPPPPSGVTAAQVSAIVAAQTAAQAALTKIVTDDATLKTDVAAAQTALAKVATDEATLKVDITAAQTAAAKVQSLLGALKPTN